ncbi:MAG: GNAT family N-acetyltransferase [Gemmatimonadales bacterium]
MGADARYCQRQYLKELDRRFDRGFDPGRSIAAEPREFRAPAGVFLVARLRGDPIGCGGLKLRERAPAEVKRMWVAPAARGLGVGARLTELEARAAAGGGSIVRLETNRALAEAIAMYRSRGYREVAPFSDDAYADHWFEKRLG